MWNPSCKGVWHTGFSVLQEAPPLEEEVGMDCEWVNPYFQHRNWSHNLLIKYLVVSALQKKQGELSEETLLTLGKNQRKTDYKSKCWDHTWALWWQQPPYPKARLPRPLRLGCAPSPSQSSGPRWGQHLIQDTQVRFWWLLFLFIPQAQYPCSNGLGVLRPTHLIWALWTGSVVGTIDDSTSWFRPPALLASKRLCTGPFWCETTFMLRGMTQVAV